jgi:hypothetical protein
MGRTDDELRQKLQELETRDIQLRAEVQAYGIDLAKKRVLDLTFWAPDEETAKKLAEALTRNEMPPNLVLGPARRDEPDQRWVVRSPIGASVDFVTANENVVTFIMFADKYDCEYDGWGTAIVEAAPALQDKNKPN